MDYSSIKRSIDAYFAGESSLEEEKNLKMYFSSEHVDDRLKIYQPLFRAFVRDQAVHLKKNDNIVGIKQVKTFSRVWRNRWLSTAAGFAVLIFALYYIFVTPQQPTKMEQQQALEQVESALRMVSVKMNQGAVLSKRNLYKISKATSKIRN